MQDLEALRRDIDLVDRQLLELLAHRFRIVERVVAVKSLLGLPARIPDRISEVIESREAQGQALGLPPATAAKLWAVIVEETCRNEEARFAALARTGLPTSETSSG